MVPVIAVPKPTAAEAAEKAEKKAFPIDHSLSSMQFESHLSVTVACPLKFSASSPIFEELLRLSQEPDELEEGLLVAPEVPVRVAAID